MPRNHPQLFLLLANHALGRSGHCRTARLFGRTALVDSSSQPCNPIVMTGRSLVLRRVDRDGKQPDVIIPKAYRPTR
eukprot:1195602-Prorocentrum_minimum.AAC.3